MTATAVTAADLSGDEVVELGRQRRELVTKVEDAREDRSRLQTKLKALGTNLEDKGIVAHIQQLQGQLERSSAACTKAEKALAAFDRENPTQEQLDVRAGAIAAEKARQARDAARKPFLENRKKAIQLLERLLTLDAEARQMVGTAPMDTFANGAEATDLADLIVNWQRYNRDADGVNYLKQALKSI